MAVVAVTNNLCVSWLQPLAHGFFVVMKLIPLGGKAGAGKFVKVDDDWFEYLSQWSWSYSKGYAVRVYRTHYTCHVVRMHRVIAAALPDEIVDHINGDSLDNQGNNLRRCTQGVNIQNSKLRSNNQSGYKGVSFDKRDGSWRSRISFKHRELFIGSFPNARFAAMAYDIWARELYGVNATVNFKVVKWG